jgi:hypothetical protein
VCAGLYPNIVRVEEPAGAGKGAKPAKGPPKPPKLFTQSVKDPKPTPVSIHPCSVNFNRAKFPTRWLVRPPPPLQPSTLRDAPSAALVSVWATPALCLPPRVGGEACLPCLVRATAATPNTWRIPPLAVNGAGSEMPNLR